MKEKATGTFQVGLGFSNVENFIFTAQVSQNNFLGWGQTRVGLGADLQPAPAHPAVASSTRTSSTPTSSVRRLLPQRGRLRRLRPPAPRAATSSLGYQVLEDVLRQRRATRGVRGRRAGRADSAPRAAGQPVPQRRHAARVRLSVTWDRRDNRLFPSSGFIYSGSVEYAPRPGPRRHASSSPATRPTRASTSRCRWALVFKTNITIGYIQRSTPTARCPSPSSTSWAASTPCAATCCAPSARAS